MSIINRLASAAYNDIVSGLKGFHHNSSINIELLEDEIVATRMSVIKLYILKGIVPIKDLLEAINCVQVDCKDLDRCTCNSDYVGEPQAHFTIPAIMADVFGTSTIQYIGSTDRKQPFLIYSSPYELNYLQKYRKRGKHRPWVYLDLVPNADGWLDGYIFNAPYIKEISVVAVFKDPRELEEFLCCQSDDTKKFSYIDEEVKNRVVDLYIKYYRQLAAPIIPNDQKYTP